VCSVCAPDPKYGRARWRTGWIRRHEVGACGRGAWDLNGRRGGGRIAARRPRVGVASLCGRGWADSSLGLEGSPLVSAGDVGVGLSVVTRQPPRRRVDGRARAARSTELAWVAGTVGGAWATVSNRCSRLHERHAARSVDRPKAGDSGGERSNGFLNRRRFWSGSRMTCAFSAQPSTSIVIVSSSCHRQSEECRR